MAEPHRQSVLSTRVRWIRREGRTVVEKRAAIQVAMEGFGPDRLARAVRAYHDQLAAAGVPVPELLEVEEDGPGILIVQEDAGEPLLASADDIGPFLSDPALTEAVLAVLETARAGGVWLDPHPKNFCGYPAVHPDAAHADAANPDAAHPDAANPDAAHPDPIPTVRYVDLWQPIGSVTYRAARVAAEPEATRDLVRDCLEVFAPERLVLHFVGDVLGMAPDAGGWARDVVRKAGLVGPRTAAELVEEARAIRALEDRRLELGIHLV